MVRIKWIDGLKGFACMCIFFHHFFMFFLPALYSGKIEDSHIGDIETRFASAPISFILNGNFWVCVYLLLSGLVVAYGMLRALDLKQEGKMLFKRFPQLMLPLFVASAIVWIMLKYSVFQHRNIIGVTRNEYGMDYLVSPVSFNKLLYESIYAVWFDGAYTFSPPFWMLKYVFYGSVITFIISIIVRRLSLCESLIICLACGCLLCFRSPYYSNTIAGIIIAKTIISLEDFMFLKNNTKIRIVFGILFVVCGAFFGGFPTGFSGSAWYVWIQDCSYINIHVIGAFLLCVGLAIFPYGCMKVKWLINLGKISYAVFLLHFAVICSVSCKAFLFFYYRGVGYVGSVLLSAILSLIILIFASCLFYNWVQINCSKFINLIGNRLYDYEHRK